MLDILTGEIIDAQLREIEARVSGKSEPISQKWPTLDYMPGEYKAANMTNILAVERAAHEAYDAHRHDDIEVRIVAAIVAAVQTLETPSPAKRGRPRKQR